MLNSVLSLSNLAHTFAIRSSSSSINLRNPASLIGRSASSLRLRTFASSAMTSTRHLVAQANDFADGDKVRFLLLVASQDHDVSMLMLCCWWGMQQQVQVGETPLLLFKLQGQFHATGAKCTHYGAPLVKGVLTSSGRL